MTMVVSAIIVVRRSEGSSAVKMCRRTRKSLWITCSLLMTFGLSSCVESSESGVADTREPTSEPLDDASQELIVAMSESPISDADDATRRFESLLSTPYVDENSHETWMCLDAGIATEYRLMIDDDGGRRGDAAYDSGASETFTWMATAVDALLIDFTETGRALQLSSFRFDGEDAFRADFGSGSTLECRRQIYLDGEPTLDTTDSMPIEIGREMADTLQLAERLATRYVSARDYDYWFCVIENSEPDAYLFVAAGHRADAARALTLASGVPRDLPDDAPIVGWSTSDGATLILTPEDADGRPRGSVEDVVALRAVVFPLDGAFTATRQDGASLQCLLQSYPN